MTRKDKHACVWVFQKPKEVCVVCWRMGKERGEMEKSVREGFASPSSPRICITRHVQEEQHEEQETVSKRTIEIREGNRAIATDWFKQREKKERGSVVVAYAVQRGGDIK